MWLFEQYFYSPLSCFCKPSVVSEKRIKSSAQRRWTIISLEIDYLCGAFTGLRWIPRTKGSDPELWCFFFIYVWINNWVNNGEAGDLRRYRIHYVVNVMKCRGAEQPISHSPKYWYNTLLTHLCISPHQREFIPLRQGYKEEFIPLRQGYKYNGMMASVSFMIE